MNERTEKKLKDLSGMNKATNELLQQTWERGRKYGQKETEDQFYLKALPDCPYYLPCGHCDILVQRYKNSFDAQFQDAVCSCINQKICPEVDT